MGAINHMIMLPAYKEDIDTLQETLDVFASHEQAKSDYHVRRSPPFLRLLLPLLTSP